MERLCEKSLSLRCYALLRGNLYYAECIDLGIVVAKPSLEEALAALDDAIELTLESAVSHGFLDEVLKRKSPWQNRLLYHWIGMLIRLEGLARWLSFDEGPQPVRFRRRCPTHA